MRVYAQRVLYHWSNGLREHSSLSFLTVVCCVSARSPTAIVGRNNFRRAAVVRRNSFRRAAVVRRNNFRRAAVVIGNSFRRAAVVRRNNFRRAAVVRRNNFRRNAVVRRNTYKRNALPNTRGGYRGVERALYRGVGTYSSWLLLIQLRRRCLTARDAEGRNCFCSLWRDTELSHRRVRLQLSRVPGKRVWSYMQGMQSGASRH